MHHKQTPFVWFFAALFQSMLYEACGLTMNPVYGATRKLWMGNWNICEAAVETALRGGSLRPLPELLTHGVGSAGFPSATSEEASGICTELLSLQHNNSGDRYIYHHSRFTSSRSRSTFESSPTKRKRSASEQEPSSELDLSLPITHLRPPNLLSFLSQILRFHSSTMAFHGLIQHSLEFTPSVRPRVLPYFRGY